MRMRERAEAIGEELDEQNCMLDNVESGIDAASENMGVVMSRLTKLLKTKDRCHLCTIAGLALVVVGLAVLVVLL